MEPSDSRTVVIVDEHSLVAEGIACLCNRSGRYRVVGHFDDVETAWRGIQEQRPELVLVDFSLPGLLAMDLVRRMQQAELPCRTIMLSSRRDRGVEREALRSGASAYLPKGSTSAQLLECLDEVARGGTYSAFSAELNGAHGTNGDSERDPMDALSGREVQVFSLLVEGVRAKEIAARLSLSPKTVDTYRASLMRKLSIFDVAGLVKFAIRRELVPHP